MGLFYIVLISFLPLSLPSNTTTYNTLR